MSEIEIVSYQPEYRQAFERLNRNWIEKLFKIEARDEEILADPEGTILAKGGHIYFAKFGEEIVGCCAVVTNAEGVFELVKMGVEEEYQGKQIGTKLVSACIDKARGAGGNTIVLETNSQLLPAIRIYEKLGFKKVENYQGHFARADYCMSLALKPELSARKN
jgi:putative acetyltransferase